MPKFHDRDAWTDKYFLYRTLLEWNPASRLAIELVFRQGLEEGLRTFYLASYHGEP